MNRRVQTSIKERNASVPSFQPSALCALCAAPRAARLSKIQPTSRVCPEINPAIGPVSPDSTHTQTSINIISTFVSFTNYDSSLSTDSCSLRAMFSLMTLIPGFCFPWQCFTHDPHHRVLFFMAFVSYFLVLNLILTRLFSGSLLFLSLSL